MIFTTYTFDEKVDLIQIFDKIRQLTTLAENKHPNSKISLRMSIALIDKIHPSYDGTLEYDFIGIPCLIDTTEDNLKVIIEQNKI